MPSTKYQVPSTSHSLSRLWLLIGVFALAVAGLYSLTLVIGRAPVLSNNAEIQRIFKDALVVHVDLSVLVWFLAIACMLWSLLAQGARSVVPYLEEAALWCLGIAIVLMMLSPFMPNAQALMSNYIPTISSPVFLMSLGFVLCAVLFMLAKLISGQWTVDGGQSIPSFLACCPPSTVQGLRFGILSAGWITLIAILCFVWSFHLMPPVIEGEQYFDMVFWGGGHVLQLTHAQVLMVVWLLMIASLRGAGGDAAIQSGLLRCARNDKLLYPLFSIGLISAVLSLPPYFLYDIASSEFRQYFTHKMIALDGLAPGLLGIFMLCWLWKARDTRKGMQRALWSCALVSVLLFLYGGVLGLLIRGQNVVIPAHYHGAIVGITLAFMGFAYLMLPRFGYRDPVGWRLAYWQPIVYGIGQVMHVSGLAYSGGYGVLRKTAGGVDALPINIKMALGVMGIGGVLAIAGGLLFVVVVYKALKNK